MTAITEVQVFVAALRVEEIFADPTYQRTLDVGRARKMCATWDRRLAGILEVSDRGEEHHPRYAVIDGQHRWGAARFLVDPAPLVANVHTGLTLADEAKLFDQLNRQRKQTNSWDHWKARRAAGDDQVLAIDAVVEGYGLRVEMGPVDGYLSCTSTLEKVTKLGGTVLLDEVIRMITNAWGNRRDAFDSPIVNGIALVLHHLRDELDVQRLTNTLIDAVPRQIRTQASAMREMSPGTLPVVTAMVIIGLYNKRTGRKIDVNHKTFGGTGIRNNAPKAQGATVSRQTTSRMAARSHMQSPALEQVGEPKSTPRTVPTGLPPTHPETDQYADAVADMEGKPVTEIAASLGIPERSVRRIQADLGMGTI